MRFIPFAASATLLVGVATFACSSSEPAATTPDAGEGSLAPEREGSEDDSPPSDGENDGDEDGSNQDTPPTDGGTEGGGQLVDADKGDGNAGTLCAAGDVKESESNDTVATADPLPGVPSAYCGRLEAGDTDYASFTLNGAGFSGSFSYSKSPVTITATVEGETFSLSGNGYIFKPGKLYVLKITAAAPTDYRVRLQPP